MEIEDSNYHLLDRVSITSSSEGFANADVAVLLGNNAHVFQLCLHRSMNQLCHHRSMNQLCHHEIPVF